MKAKKVAAYGILVALAIALSYLENLIPWTVAAPGVKLGLANTVTIFALYRLSFRDACAISLLRVLLVGILFGNAFSLAFSAAGAIVSTMQRASNADNIRFFIVFSSFVDGLLQVYNILTNLNHSLFGSAL